MIEELPRVTVIIAARPDQAEVKAVDAARRLVYPREKLEILVARGRQPSVQRNTAIRAAKGDLVYFLDDDSVPDPQNLARAVQHFMDKQVLMAGGPNLCPPDAPNLERVFAVVLASWLAFGPSRARYAQVGTARPSGEKELILCNLISRRDAVMRAGCFNEALYPNEENALMDELQKAGGILVYDPGLFVFRRPRPSLGAFIRMLRTYGRGRAEQFRLHPTMGSAPNFVPPLFVVYLLAVAGACSLPRSILSSTWIGWILSPLMLYAVALLGQTLVSMASHGARALLAAPLLVASHIFYGIGFWRGLFTKLQRDPEQRGAVPVVIESLS